jgi:phosphonopyruvate decarboxylase
MIHPKDFFNKIGEKGINFYAGVPDSLLANFCNYVNENSNQENHIITANEGNAVALALGYHLATGKIAAVYMQNSGLGNAINPLVSLADPEVYKVPMMLLIGWRGEPDISDEPQHIKQGRITLEQLNILEIPYFILDGNSDLVTVLDESFSNMIQRNAPTAIIVRKGTFSNFPPIRFDNPKSNLVREVALDQLLNLCSSDDLIVVTTGKTSREIFDLRSKRNENQRDFLTVGGMGHTSSIALGIALGQPYRRVICLDGDGSMIMHMGSMPIIGKCRPKNFLHVLLNNEAHESVGGQATAASNINFEKLALSLGYEGYAVAHDTQSLINGWECLKETTGPVLFEIKIKIGSRDDLGRPTSTPEQNKISFMKAIHDKSG